MLNKDDQKKLQIQQKIAACNKVIKTLDTEGWKDVIEPLLNAMIEDLTGRKKGDVWVKGLIHQSKDKMYAIGYQDALITLYNAIMGYKINLSKLEEGYKEMSDPKKKVLVTSMEKSKYAVHKDKLG